MELDFKNSGLLYSLYIMYASLYMFLLEVILTSLIELLRSDYNESNKYSTTKKMKQKPHPCYF